MSAFNPIGNKPWTKAEHRREHQRTKETAMPKKTAAAPYYVNPHTKEPVEYANIIAYCRYGRSKPYWVRAQIEQAKAINAPQTTVSVSDGKAVDFYDLKNPALMEAVVAILERGVAAPPPEKPCQHCQEDTSDGFHSCDGTEDASGVV